MTGYRCDSIEHISDHSSKYIYTESSAVKTPNMHAHRVKCCQVVHAKSVTIVKEYCFASPKAKTTYTVHIVLKTRGEIVGGACTCVAGKGQAYIHIAALLFYLEDSAMVWSDTLPLHNSKANRYYFTWTNSN